ncbi:PREDICTED: uncharacterized protein LOC105451559 [Wasmannia auropunctata]|uniref:uncharacterized protein LOC105451559 n=1 Tax=Wasmannia auropunctata TaxID=64793 RepID=UPI0005EE6FAD|nr:PREDICTED: uncharacterized protein LOC105451559 [Wasmannia auropunctata]XP_011690384.1 PREDICTED: uncharacterized protein LOC105451559 [Wasmannia auropunctata]
MEEQHQNIHKGEKYGYNVATTHPNNSKVEMNVPVDILLKVVMKYIKQNTECIIYIPNLKEITYYIGLGITCYFESYNGTFEGISTLKRTKDVFISNLGQKYTIEADFKLPTAKLKYNYYKFTVGLIPVSGDMVVTIDELAIAVKLFMMTKDVIISNIDNKRQMYTIETGFKLSTAKLKYNYYKLSVGSITVSGDVLVTIDGLVIAVKLFMIDHKKYPCYVQYVQVTEIGKINIEMTGLGLFNSFISNLMTQKITEWQEKIIKKIEVQFRDIIEEQLNN